MYDEYFRATIIYLLCFCRSNCDQEATDILRRHYKRPYFLPLQSESSKTDWIFMGSPGYGAHMHVCYGLCTLLTVFIFVLLKRKNVKGNRNSRQPYAFSWLFDICLKSSLTFVLKVWLGGIMMTSFLKNVFVS